MSFWCILPISSENNKKLKWIEKLDFILSVVKSTWNGTFMITEGSNIHLFESTEIQKRYIEVLETYPLNNHTQNQPELETYL